MLILQVIVDSLRSNECFLFGIIAKSSIFVCILSLCCVLCVCWYLSIHLSFICCALLAWGWEFRDRNSVREFGLILSQAICVHSASVIYVYIALGLVLCNKYLKTSPLFLVRNVIPFSLCVKPVYTGNGPEL